MRFDQLSKGKKIIAVIIILMPIIVSVAGIIYIKVARPGYIPGEMPSPVNNKPILIGLSAFTLGYLFFLCMMFSENIVRLFHKKTDIQK